jgi:tetratricopeptide (TPR) repeat protein
MQLKGRAGYDYGLVGLVALGARLAHAWFVSRTPFFEGPVIDAAVNRGLALQLAAGGDAGSAFYQPPLYAAFLSLLFRLGLSGAWAVAIVQALLGAATALILTALGRKLASGSERERAVGLACGLGAALYGPFILFDLELLPPCLIDLLLAGALWLSLRVGPLQLADAVLGLVVGLAVVGWPPSLLLFPMFLLLRVRRVVGSRARLVALVLLSAVPPLGATARYNARHGGDGVLVSYNTGINLWLGNNPNWRDTWRARPGASFEPELERPDRRGATTPAARSAYFERRALQDVKQRPLAFVARSLEKFYYMLAGRELRRDQDIQLLREASPVLRGLLWEAGLAFPFGLVAPLALCALVRRRREPDVRLLAAGAGAYAGFLALFIVSARYRLPLALLFLPLAADQLLWLWRARARPPLPSLGLAAALLLALNWPNRFTASFAATAAERGLLEATAFRNQGQYARASQLAEALSKRFPDDPNVLMLRAELLATEERCREAEPLLVSVIRLAPRTATPRILLASCYESLGDLPAAERQLANALALHPYHPVGLRNASLLLARERRVKEARRLAGRFLASGYDDPQLAQLAGE